MQRVTNEELINGCTMFSFDYKVGSDAHFYLKENKVEIIVVCVSFLLDTLNERYLGNPSRNMSQADHPLGLHLGARKGLNK